MITLSNTLTIVIGIIITIIELTGVRYNSVFKKVNKMFGKYIKRKTSRGSLSMVNTSELEEEAESEYILGLEKKHMYELQDVVRDKNIDIENKYRLKIYSGIGAISVFLNVLIGDKLMAIVGLGLVISSLLASNNKNLAILSVLAGPINPLAKIILLTRSVIDVVFPPATKLIDKIVGPSMVLIGGLSMNSNKLNRQWEEIFDEWEIDKTDKISPGWKELGLVNKENSCVVINAYENPEKENIKTRVLLTDICSVSKTLEEKGRTWVASDLSNLMHARALVKRLIEPKKKINNNTIKKMNDTIKMYFSKLPWVEKKDLMDYVNTSLGTQGTAGEFAKRTLLEPVWKDKNNLEISLTWKSIIKIMYNYTATTWRIPENLDYYMVYRKNEVIEKEDDMINPRVTRTMQSPDLVIRVCDLPVFYPMNEAIAENHKELIAKVGINIFEELKWVLKPMKGYNTIGADFSNFDSTQHPSTIAACMEARMMHAQLNNRFDIIKMSYLYAHYKIHMYKTCHSSNSIELKLLGQQSSGDITTSDDNTMRTTAYCIMVGERIRERAVREEGLIDDCEFCCQGDDVIINTENDERGCDIIQQEMVKISEELGWKLRYSELQDNIKVKRTFLAHSVRLQMISNGNDIIMIPLIYRDGNRVYGKWFNSYDLYDSNSITTRMNICTKMLSYCFCMISMTGLFVNSLIAAIKCRTAVDDSKLKEAAYSWSSIEFKAIKALDITEAIKLQTNMIYEIEEIEVDKNEIEEFLESLTVCKQEFDKIIKESGISLREFSVKDQYRYSSGVLWFKIRGFTKLMLRLATNMDRVSSFVKRRGMVNWWEEAFRVIENKSSDSYHVMRKANIYKLCEHVTNNYKLEGEVDTAVICNSCCINSERLIVNKEIKKYRNYIIECH